MAFLKSIKLSGFLSFPPDAEAIPLTPLNVIIGPNGSGKSNLIEAIELLRSTPTSLAEMIRAGGIASEWIWKGEPRADRASISATFSGTSIGHELRHEISFRPAGLRLEVTEESIENETSSPSQPEFYYRLAAGNAVINACEQQTTTTPPPTTPPPPSGRAPSPNTPPTRRGYLSIPHGSLASDQSVLSQLRDRNAYPEMAWLREKYSGTQIFRDWVFGRGAPLRSPQRTDLNSTELLQKSENLALILNELQNSIHFDEFNRLMLRFIPRYQRFSTSIYGGSMQFYLHEHGLSTPVSGTRLSDGTIRFMAILALLLSPNPPPLLCIDDPELGLHPDAMSQLADLLVDASQRMQLIVTTHSESLISALTEEADSVLVCNHIGGTTLERVNKEQVEHWLEDYRLGEAWRVGAIGGNP